MGHGEKEKGVYYKDDEIEQRTQIMKVAYQMALWRWRNQAGPEWCANIAGQKSHSQNKYATQVTGQIVSPVVSAIGKKEKGHSTIKSHENIPHVAVVVGADRRLDFLAIPKKRRPRQKDKRKGDTQNAYGSPHGIIGDNLGWFAEGLLLGSFHPTGNLQDQFT
jgi:hypothetical protein